MLSDRVLILGYLYGLIAAIIALTAWLGLKWGMIISSILTIALSFPLAYYILKKNGLIEWAKSIGSYNSRVLLGLEMLRSVRPKKAAEMEPAVLEELEKRKNEKKLLSLQEIPGP